MCNVRYLGERVCALTVWVMMMLMSSALPPSMGLQTPPYASIAENQKIEGLSLDDCTIMKFVGNMAGKGGRRYDTGDDHLHSHISITFPEIYGNRDLQ
jgi:hypothetical protein